MKLALLAALLLAGHPRTSQVSTTLRVRPPAGTYLDMPLNVPGAYASGTGLDTRGGPTTCARDCTATYSKSDGLLELAAINTCRVELTGLRVEEARTNLRPYGSDISAGVTASSWFVAGTGVAAPTVTHNACTAPDGTLTADQFDFAATNASGQKSILYFGTAVTAAPTTYSFYAKTTAGAGTLYSALYVNPADTTNTANSLTTTWQRFTVTRTTTGATWYFVLGPFTNIVTPAQPLVQSALSACIWGMQVETGAFATSYIPTAGSAVQRVADVTSIPWPARATVSGLWSISADVTPISTWSRTAYVFGPQTATNSIFVLLTAGHVYFQINDGGGEQRYVDYAASPAAGQHKLTACYTKSSAPELYLDGVRVGSVTGDGTGILTTMPANLVLGANAGAGSELSGNIRNVRVTAGCKP